MRMKFSYVLLLLSLMAGCDESENNWDEMNWDDGSWGLFDKTDMIWVNRHFNKLA